MTKKISELEEALMAAKKEIEDIVASGKSDSATVSRHAEVKSRLEILSNNLHTQKVEQARKNLEQAQVEEKKVIAATIESKNIYRSKRALVEDAKLSLRRFGQSYRKTGSNIRDRLLERKALEIKIIETDTDAKLAMVDYEDAQKNVKQAYSISFAALDELEKLTGKRL